jgi:hypothetical protein
MKIITLVDLNKKIEVNSSKDLIATLDLSPKIFYNAYHSAIFNRFDTLWAYTTKKMICLFTSKTEALYFYRNLK